MRVEWTDECLDRLADIIVTLDLTGQDLIEKAVKDITAALARDPWDRGESRSRLNRRAWFVPPL